MSGDELAPRVVLEDDGASAPSWTPAAPIEVNLGGQLVRASVLAGAIAGEQLAALADRRPDRCDHAGCTARGSHRVEVTLPFSGMVQVWFACAAHRAAFARGRR